MRPGTRIALRLVAAIMALLFLLVGSFFGLFYLPGNQHPNGPGHPIVVIIALAAVAMAALFAFIAVTGREPYWVRPPKRPD